MNVYKELSKDNINNVVYIEENIGTKSVKKYIHSKYNPINEAKEWAINNFDENKEVYIIFGGGLLYHIKELAKLISIDSKIILIEPIKEIYKAILEEDILVQLNSDSRFNMIVANSKYDMLNFLKRTVKISELKDIKICRLESYEIIFPKLYSEYIKSVNNLIIHKKLDGNTFDFFSFEFTDNMINNLCLAAKSHFLMEFKDKFKNKTAIIVSAGPSLVKNIDLLKGNEDKFIIISGGRTLKTLLNKGIKPHFVVSIDPGKANYKLFESILDSSVPIVSGFINNKDIIRKYRGEKIFINDSVVDGIDKQILNINVDSISGGGSVATYQMTFAEYIGCKTIVLIGQDLAYTDNKFHADIAAEKNNNVLENKNLIKVKGINSEYVYTSRVLNTYKDWFENYAYVMTNLTIINATEGGAYIEGMEHMSFEEVIRRYSNIPQNYYDEIENSLINKSVNIDELEVKKNVVKMLNDTNKIIKLSKEAIKITNSLRTENNKLSDLSRLSKIDKMINKLEKTTLPAAVLIQKELLLFEDIKMKDENEIIKVNKLFYELVYDTYMKFKEIIEEALKLYKN